MAKSIKLVRVEATFPNGRVVSGVMRVPPHDAAKPFQVFDSETSLSSTIINPLMAESISINVIYED